MSCWLVDSLSRPSGCLSSRRAGVPTFAVSREEEKEVRHPHQWFSNAQRLSRPVCLSEPRIQDVEVQISLNWQMHETLSALSLQSLIFQIWNVLFSVQHFAWYTCFLYIFKRFYLLLRMHFLSERRWDCDGIRCRSWPDSLEVINPSLLMKVKAFIFIRLKFHLFPGLLWLLWVLTLLTW